MQKKIVNNFLQTDVEVITNENDIYKGFLIGIDQAMNLILQNCYKLDLKNNKHEKLDLFIIRGDIVQTIGGV